MNNKKIFLIILPIAIIISLIGILKLNQYKYEIDKQNLIEGYNFKDDNEIQNEENQDKFEIVCNFDLDLVQKLENLYIVDVNISSEKCMKKLYDVTDELNRTLLADWTHNEGNTKSQRLEIQKDKLNKYEIELASGKIIKKEIDVNSLKFKLKDNIFKYCSDNGITLDDIGFSIISKSNCEYFNYSVDDGIGGGRGSGRGNWNCDVKLDFNELNEKFDIGKVKTGISFWADGWSTSGADYKVYYTDETSDTYSFTGMVNGDVWRYIEDEFEVPEGKVIDYIVFYLYGYDGDYTSTQAIIKKIELN